MKTQRIFFRLLIPKMVALLLLPPLSCLIFHHTAKQYAYQKAEQIGCGRFKKIEPAFSLKVLENLLTNAIRYAKTTVTISLVAHEDQTIIAVSDDGDGIDEKDLPHLFERCYKGRGGNFGIGLAIAHSAAKKMGGHLEATNQPEGGAVFRLFLKRP